MKRTISIISLAFMFALVAHASEVTGSFGGATVAPSSTQGGTISGTVGSSGSSDVGGTLSGGVSGGSGSTAGASSASAGSPGGGTGGSSGLLASNTTASPDSFDDSAFSPSTGPEGSSGLTGDETASPDLADNTIPGTAYTPPSPAVPDNAAQVAAVGSLGISTGDVVRWLILLAALGVLGYYLLRRSQTGSAL